VTGIEDVGGVLQARLEAHLVPSFENVALDDGSRVDLDVNMRCRVFFDVTNGRVAREEVHGTVGIRPRDISTPPMEARLSYELRLVE